MVPPKSRHQALLEAARASVFYLLLCATAQAGGPSFVAGTAFDPAISGKPILWANGNISYYTDQGDLSPLLPQSAANLFVADAFSRWTSVTTAALTATRSGALAEDVNGSNVVATQPGVSLPSDIQPSAAKPIAIVYDFDGAVTDALLGASASDPSLCATNSILGGVDRFLSDGHIAHALLIINGRCAQTSSDLMPLKYRLIRAIGGVLGVGWSQANDNVLTNSPFPNSQDYAGFPLMHPVEPFCAGAITSCLPNTDQLRMDDRATISRLYPVTAQNQSAFPGKQIFSATTVRIRGSVYFPDVHGNAAQPMQGVNVVARLIDPNTGLVSRSAVVTSVSGFLFRGNAGNPVTGYGNTQRFDSFGGADPALEGFFDLSGLELPVGQTSASFQLTVEPTDPLYRDDSSVGPYTSGIVSPSGTHAAIALSNLAAGADVQQNIVMAAASSTTSADQAKRVQRPVPQGGDWWGALSGYGRAEFYRLSAKANRTIGFQVIAMNESLQPVANKAQPELGLWANADPNSSVAQAHADAFNGASTGSTILVTSVSAGIAQVGIADDRGDGRPDYIYHARFLYADTVTPPRIAAAGATLQISGVGFRQGMAVSVGGAAATILAIDENSIHLQAPALSGGSKSIVVQEALSGLSTTMTNAITYGILSGDQLVSVAVSNPTVAVGMTAPNAVRFKVVAVDGITPVAGASVTFSVAPTSSHVNACGASSCTLTADANGEVGSFVTVMGTGANIVTASLSNGQQKSTTIVGASTLILAAVTPQVRLLSGSSQTISLPVRLLSGGSGMSGKTINYSLVSGSGTFGTSSAVTDLTGSASANLTVTNFTASASVNACMATTCAQFSIFPIAANAVALQTISGDAQMIAVGQSPQPVILRVVDTATPPNVLTGVPVTITGAVFAASRPDCALDTGICRPAMPHALATFSATLTSDANGLVSYTPALQAGWGAVNVGMTATAGTIASQPLSLQVFSPGP